MDRREMRPYLDWLIISVVEPPLARITPEDCRNSIGNSRPCSRMKLGTHYRDSNYRMDNLLGASDAVVGAHLLLVEQVQNSLLDGTRMTVRDHDRQRREVLAEIRMLRTEWKKILASFDKTRRSRDGAVKAAEDARAAFEKANNDKNVTKAYVEKCRDEYAIKARKALVYKEEYIQAARIINGQQKKHYEEDLPATFDKLQKIEETRLAKIKLHLNEFGLLITSALAEELNGFRDMLSKWDRLVPNTIVQKFIDENRDDAPFEFPETILIDESASIESLGLTSRTTTQNRIESALISSDDPEVIQTRLDELSKRLLTLEKQREGAKILRDMYVSRPELADQKTKTEAAKELDDLTSQLECLQIEQEQLQEKLESLAKADTFSARSVQSAPSSPVLWEEATANMESPIPGAPNSCLSAIETNPNEKLKALFNATAIFDFEATESAHELSIKSGETVTILSNDGEWWQAQNADGSIGFVPFNYVRQE
ncbi:hypothetical protein PSACC_00263 [Paramicrosporidium saccamoebae]|uniref:SH3 domain-containing protein n=1 Tax=Paramicrosporidium saccamoebae TaxID=1246581 RepID=A0A2H9TQA1_9FUNG|nr:hypothetical protein PSACC_00263 [Paramicrosporidium saccamoebae]